MTIKTPLDFVEPSHLTALPEDDYQPLETLSVTHSIMPDFFNGEAPYIQFHGENKEVIGSIWHHPETGFTFEGDAHESAKQFMEFLARQFKEYIDGIKDDAFDEGVKHQKEEAKKEKTRLRKPKSLHHGPYFCDDSSHLHIESEAPSALKPVDSKQWHPDAKRKVVAELNRHNWPVDPWAWPLDKYNDTHFYDLAKFAEIHGNVVAVDLQCDFARTNVVCRTETMGFRNEGIIEGIREGHIRIA